MVAGNDKPGGETSLGEVGPFLERSTLLDCRLLVKIHEMVVSLGIYSGLRPLLLILLGHT